MTDHHEVPTSIMLGTNRDRMNFDITTVSVDNTNSMLGENILWIDYELTDNETIRAMLLQRYDQGFVTVFIGDSIMKEDVFNYFEIDNPFRYYYLGEGFSHAGFLIQNVDGLGEVCGVQYLFTDSKTTIYHPIAAASITQMQGNPY